MAGCSPPPRAALLPAVGRATGVPDAGRDAPHREGPRRCSRPLPGGSPEGRSRRGRAAGIELATSVRLRRCQRQESWCLGHAGGSSKPLEYTGKQGFYCKFASDKTVASHRHSSPIRSRRSTSSLVATHTPIARAVHLAHPLCRPVVAEVVEDGAKAGASEQRVERIDGAMMEHGVEHIDDARTGLVDAEHYGVPARLGLGPERAHDLERGRAVEARRGLVEHQHGGVAHGLDADGHAPALSAGEVLDPGIGDASERKVVNERVNRGGVLCVRAEAKARVEVERLAHYEQREDDVALGGVATEAANGRSPWRPRASH
ncbi:uncharacterized protein LOC125554606 [Triticum urartu]|uniref:uncharacterized protein LOC125554606 n=1 Tax=Triticum urartu TaxID=4572 RepID=UPI00204450F2|nr:uncharacterized protein LOC125554606 [Triticum urartu]